MSETGSKSEVVVELAEEFIDRYRRGERPPLAEYTAKYPDLAERILDVFPAMAMMENIAIHGDASEASGAGGPASETSHPASIGDYRIIREVGRGGMGIVYEAEQLSLGRRVALKVLPQQMLLDKKHKRRFEREAKAAAKLHHTNIVPVFGVGEQDGLHYYVMQFIQGLGLDEVIGELQRMKASSQVGRPASHREMRAGRPSGDFSAAHVARSLMSGEFERTVLTVQEREEALPERFGSTVGFDPNGAQARVNGPVTGLEVQQSGQGVLEMAVHSAGLNVSSDGRSSDSLSVSSSLSLSGSLSLSNQSDVSTSTSASRARRKQTFWTSVANIGRQVASALQYAHEQGITHRDIKPSNLLLDMRGTVWVTDFGLAKATDQQDITHTGDILGTLRYMPPEAFEGKSGPAGDQYSLGLTLYELLAQRPAFDEKDRHKLIKLVTTTEPPRLEKTNRDVPHDLATIVHKAIDRDPSHRYGSARELADDLARFLDDEPIKARRVSLAERLERWSRRNKGLAVALWVISALVLIMAVSSTVAAGYFRAVAREKSTLAEDNRRLAEAQTEQAERMRSLAQEKGRLAEERETERRNAEQAKTEALAAKSEIERQSREIDLQRQRAEQSLYVSQIALAERHLEAADSINARRSLDAAVPGDGERDRRGWEWYYLNHWRDSASRTLTGHSARFVYALAISPDGRWLASAGGGNPYFANPRAVVEPGEVLLREFQTGRVVHVLQGHENIGSALAFSPDGRLLATGGHDQRVILWQTQTGEPIQTIIHPRAAHLRDAHAVEHPGERLIDRVHTIHFAANGSRLLVQWGEVKGLPSDHLTTTIYSLPDGRPVHEFRTSSMVVSQDGSGLYFVESQQGRRVQVLDLASLEIADLIESPLIRAPLWGLACDGARRRLAAFCREEALLFDRATGDLVQRFPAPEGTSALALSPDGRFLAIYGASNVLQVWDTENGRKAATLLGHTANVTGADFSPDSQWVATGSMDGTVRIYPAGQDGRGLGVATDQTQISALAFGDDGGTIRTANWEGDDRGIFTWTTRNVQPALAHLGRVTDSQRWPRGDFAFSPDGRRLAAPAEDDPATVRIWDAVSGDELISLADHAGPVTAVAFSGDGARLATATSTTTGAQFHVWDAATGEVLRAPHSAAHAVLAIAFSRDGKWLATGGQPILNGPGVSIWDLRTGEAKSHFRGPIQVFRVAFSPNSAQLAAADYGLAEVLVWDVEQDRQVAEFAGLHAVSDVAYSPDGSRLAAIGYDADVHLWNAETLDELLILKTLGPPTGTLGFTPRLAFSSDGSRIAANTVHGVVSVWDAGVDFVNSSLNELFTEAQRRLDEGDCEQAAAAALRAVDLQIANRPARRLQALAWFVLGDCRARQGDALAAGESRARGRSLLEGLVAEDPGDVDSATELALWLLQSQHVDWTVLEPSDMKSAGGATLTLQEDGSILAGGRNPTQDTYTLTFQCPVGEVRAIRLEALPDANLPDNGPGRHLSGNFQLAALRAFRSLTEQGEPAEVLAISDALASYESPGSNAGISGTIDEADPGVWHIWPRVGEPHQALFQLATPLVITVADQRLMVQLEHALLPPGTNLGRFRLSVTGDARAFETERVRGAVEQGQLAVFHALAIAYERNGEADKAAAALVSAIGLSASPEGLKAVEPHVSEVLRLEFDAAAARVTEVLAEVELAALSRAVSDDPDDSAAWAARGAWYIRHGRWAEGAADYSESASRQRTAGSVDWMVPTALWAYVGDAEQHRRQCLLMADRFRTSTDSPDAERTVKVMLLLEHGLDPERAPVDAFLTSLATDTVDPGLRKWFAATQALLACRSGRFDEAHRSVEESLRLVQEAGDARGSAPALFALAVQALIHARQMDPDEARHALDELKLLMCTQAGLTWNADGSLNGGTILGGQRVQHDLLIPEILRREAERLIQAPADGRSTRDKPAGDADPKPDE